ncbi:DUF6366 family protein [Alkalibacillus almallahensis]|uniref:DUF6366 family protein n=1 Tax=Alkalibacillus almallahensis TaxID=1379154 RepID=UPI001420ECD1|nr:DUF6366 family protein [Alkalibacillus almallahensis]NIK12606.1 hypothetical protein [Alkalibacillus almallahensis]
MSNNNQSPEERRERMRQEELKHPSSSAHGSNMADLVGGMSWKFTGVLILILIVGLIVYNAFL